MGRDHHNLSFRAKYQCAWDFTVQAILLSWVVSFAIYLYLNFYHSPMQNAYILLGYVGGLISYFLFTEYRKRRVSKEIIQQGPDGDWLDELDEMTRYNTPKYGDNWDDVYRVAGVQRLWEGEEILSGFLGVGFGCLWMLIVFV